VPDPLVPALDIVLPEVRLASLASMVGGAVLPVLVDLGDVEHLVETATGPLGLLIIWIYSFLIAFVLPLPSEIVLPPAETLRLGLPVEANYALVIVVSGLGKAAGSVFAFHLGQEAKQSGPVVRALRRSRFDIVEWSESKVVQVSRRLGYVGLALALCVPGFPDTLSIYAFAVLEEDYLKFAAATFVGSVGRLLITLGVFALGFSLV